MDLAIYIRNHPDHEEEIDAALAAGFKVVTSRCDVEPGDLVIPRYSVLPYPKELEVDVRKRGGRLINTTAQHLEMADIVAMAQRLRPFTPETYTTWAHLRGGPWVVKGRTNSRKHQWNRLMFCESHEDIPRVVGALLDDPLLAEQGIVVREYVPLREFGKGLNGLPITNEWRIFLYKGQIVARGYYWSSHPEFEWLGVDHSTLVRVPHAQRWEGAAPMPHEAVALALTASTLVGDAFMAIDVAEKRSGGWTVVEVNDGCMSGLSMIVPEQFYKNLRTILQADAEKKRSR